MKPCSRCGVPCRAINKLGLCVKCRKKAAYVPRDVRFTNLRVQMTPEQEAEIARRVEHYQRRAEQGKDLFTDD